MDDAAGQSTHIRAVVVEQNTPQPRIILPRYNAVACDNSERTGPDVQPHDVRRLALSREHARRHRHALDATDIAAAANVRRRGAVFIKPRLTGEEVDAHEVNGGIAPALAAF